jgi:hypothetical protein
MAQTFDIKVEGLSEINARLVELDAMAGQKLLQRAVRRSLIGLHRAAKTSADRFNRSGALSQSIKIANVKPKGQEVAAVQLGPKLRDKRAVALHNVYYGRTRKGIFYGHFLEFGRETKTGGRVQSRPWFTPAWNASRSGIIPEFQKILSQGMTRLEKRANQKTPRPEGLIDP